MTKENETRSGDAAAPGPAQRRDQLGDRRSPLNLDMVSAICPNCHILLIETSTNQIPDLGAGENTAASSGAAFSGQ